MRSRQQACEVAVAESGVTTTIVRSAFFAQNFSEGFLAGDVQASVFALPAGDVTEPIVDIDDVADVAVAALLGQVPPGRVYELTGPELLTFHDMAVDLSKATGRTITYVPVGTDGVRRRGRSRRECPPTRPRCWASCSRTSSTATTRRSRPASRKRWVALRQLRRLRGAGRGDRRVGRGAVVSSAVGKSLLTLATTIGRTDGRRVLRLAGDGHARARQSFRTLSSSPRSKPSTARS